MVDVGTKHKKKELKIGMQIVAKKRDGLVSLLKELSDVFAWKHVEMLRMDTSIVVHRLPMIYGCKHVKQKLTRIRLDILIKMKEDMKK